MRHIHRFLNALSSMISSGGRAREFMTIGRDRTDGQQQGVGSADHNRPAVVDADSTREVLIGRSEAPSVVACAQRATKPYLVVLWVAFVYAFIMNAWVVDDAYINFRTIDNWFNGYGLRWNVVERCQAFTAPMWLFANALVSRVSHEFFFTNLALSLGCCLATIWVIQRCMSREAPLKMAATLLLLLASKAFVDYTTSGLENPLSYLLAALFFGPFLFRTEQRPHALTYSYLIASFAFFNRNDTILLFIPSLVFMSYTAIRQSGWAVVRRIVVGLSPALLWVGFSVVYYGFPFPNTYYAKAPIGVSAADIFQQSFAYYLNSLAWDPPTLGLIAVMLVLAVQSGQVRIRLGALGVALYLAYILKVGGASTHMSGRFFSVPYLVSVLLLMALPFQRRSVLSLCGLAFILILFCPTSPLKAMTGYYRTGGKDNGGWGDNGIIDTRFIVQKNDGSALTKFDRRKPMPNVGWFDEGRKFRNTPERVRVGGAGPAIGFFGFAAGPEKTIIDFMGLSDPLLSHIPPASRTDWDPGHFKRKLPEGYEESVRVGENRITDPDLHVYYDWILLATQAPLFSAARFHAIWRLNSGAGRDRIDAYTQRHPQEN